ncbi:glycosyltransferase family 4 protein [Candidatus Woesearchaeota archaeon]|nr:glycosyltransferase family 4 protein [Candidatus Woesearchaeota archaeon]
MAQKDPQPQKQRKIRVLRTIESFYPYFSGATNDAFLLSQELEKKGISSPILTTNYKAPKSPAHEVMGGVKVSRFPIKIGFMKYLVTPGMKKELKNFDIINAHNHRSYQTEIAFKAAKKAGKPFIINVHGSLYGYDHYLNGLAKLPYIVYDLFGGKKIVRKADAVIVNSKEEVQDALRYGVKKEKIHVLPSGIDVKEYEPLPKDNEVITILFVGRISRNRNLEPIIKAAALLKKKGLDKKLRLVIVGGEVKSSDTSRSGYLYELNEMAEDLGVKDIVEFAGEKKDAELRKQYRTADIFVYTSLSENFGQTMLEAAAAGLPLICTKVGIAPELIVPGKTGRIVGFDDPEGICEAIIEFSDEKKRKTASEELIRKVKDEYSRERVIKSYTEILNRLARRGKKH